MASHRIVLASLAFVLCASFAGSTASYARTGAHAGGGTHLYVLLGLGNMSPGLSEFGAKMQRRGIPTTVANHGEWPALAQQAIEQYKAGRVRSIEIVGHSLGGNAAMEMAAELGRAGVPVRLVVTLDPPGGPGSSPNVRRAVNFVPRANEDHSSMIVGRERDITSYVLGSR